MKVYVLTGWFEYEGGTVLGVYSTKEMAENAPKPDTRYDWYSVDEYDLK